MASLLTLPAPGAGADIRELVAENVLLQIAAEVSGEEAKRNLDTVKSTLMNSGIFRVAICAS